MELFYHSFCTGNSFDSVVISLCVTLSPSSQTCLSMAIKCQRTKPCGQPMSLSFSFIHDLTRTGAASHSFLTIQKFHLSLSLSWDVIHSFSLFTFLFRPSSSLSHSLGPLSFHSLFTSLAALSIILLLIFTVYLFVCVMMPNFKELRKSSEIIMNLLYR